MSGSKYHENRATIGPPAKRHLKAFRWRANDGPTLNGTLIFCNISGGIFLGPPVPPSVSANASLSFASGEGSESYQSGHFSHT